MFREMRRGRQALSASACSAILRRGTSGVLALLGDDGYPYAVPMSYVYDGTQIYFHSAVTGHKIDALRRCEKASFCVIDQDRVVPLKYTTRYKSVIVFGRLEIVTDEAEKRTAIEALARRYAPEDSAANRTQAVGDFWNALCMLRLRIDHMTGKQSLELMQENS